MTMCGLTLLPRNVRPTIFFGRNVHECDVVGIAVDDHHDLVGSGTLTTAALSVARVKLAAPTTIATMSRIKIRFA
jgi:hypothetical protein